MRSAETPDASSKQIVRDAHLVAVGVGAKREQRRVLRFPAEPSNALSRFDVDDPRSPPAHAVAVAVRRVLQRDERRVGIASTRPAPNSGIGMRRAMTTASAGIDT